jgi:hypothetical protein
MLAEFNPSFSSRHIRIRSLLLAAFCPICRKNTFTMIQPGSTVRFVKMPDWVAQLPDDSRRVFEFCLGRTYRIEEIDRNGLFVLNVGSDIDGRFGGFRNDLRLEATFLEEIE